MNFRIFPHAFAILSVAALAFAVAAGAAYAEERFLLCTDPETPPGAPCLTPVENIEGCHFVGRFAHDGKAPFTWSRTCRDGLTEGEGVLEDREGNRQTGRFSAGVRQGPGRREWVDGTVHEGQQGLHHRPAGPGRAQDGRPARRGIVPTAGSRASSLPLLADGERLQRTGGVLDRVRVGVAAQLPGEHAQGVRGDFSASRLSRGHRLPRPSAMATSAESTPLE